MGNRRIAEDLSIRTLAGQRVMLYRNAVIGRITVGKVPALSNGCQQICTLVGDLGGGVVAAVKDKELVRRVEFVLQELRNRGTRIDIGHLGAGDGNQDKAVA